jgi:hypothetical protein
LGRKEGEENAMNWNETTYMPAGDPRDREEEEEFAMEMCEMGGCDCSDEPDLLCEELSDYSASMARCHDDGWFYQDEPGESFGGS